MANDINKEDPHYKGEYGSIYEVNRKFPTGGVAGDFVVIEGWAHYWNADRATWCVNAQRDSYWDELITGIIEKFKLFKGATYMGVAGLDTVPAKAIGAKMYYFATVAGTYKNFGDLVVPQGINVLYSENGSSWVNNTLLEVAQELGVSNNMVVSQKTLNDALANKFDKESVVQESGDAEDKVMSQKAVSDKLSGLSATINKESELGVTQHFVKDDFTTKVEVKETNFFHPNDVVKLICTNKSSKDSWFSVGTFGSDGSESEIQSKVIKAGETLVIDRTEQYSGNGYWCKSIGNAKGKFEVYRIDPKVTENTKELAKKIDKSAIVQESGESEDKVMSQKAVSDKLNKINNNGLKIILSKQADSGRLEFDYPYSKGTELSLVVTNLGSSEGYFTIGAIDTNGVDSEIITQKLEAGQSYTVNRKEIYSGKGYYCNSVNNKAFTYELIELNEVFRTLQAKVEFSEIRPKIYVGPTRKYTKFTDGLSKAVELGNADLYVDAGVYDIVAELTIAKIDSDSIAGYYGPKIGRGVRIYFSQGAKIVANYTGTLHDSLERFSPLNAIETTDIGGSDFEIHGGEFECTNTRYVVHDECNGKGSYKHLYENCRMILDNRNKTYFSQCQCIGGGLGEFADIQIIGGYYESKTIDISKPNKDQTISYHNPQPNFGSNFCNSVMIKDAYFKDGTIIVSQLGDSLKYSRFVVNNCSMTKAPYINGENDAGTGRFRMQSWNNDIRNS